MIRTTSRRSPRARGWRDLALRLHADANLARAAHGLPSMEWDAALEAAALGHAVDLASSGRFSHDGSDGSTAMDRVRRVSRAWRGVGENLAIGQRSPAEAVVGWLDSPGHRANLLHPELTHAGAAALRPQAASPYRGGVLWVQVYGLRVPEALRVADTASRYPRAA